jgi:hypothetical protein
MLRSRKPRGIEDQMLQADKKNQKIKSVRRKLLRYMRISDVYGPPPCRTRSGTRVQRFTCNANEIVRKANNAFN